MSDEFQAWDMSSLIWYRVKRPLANLRQSLPCLDLSDFFELSDEDKENFTLRRKKEHISDEEIAQVDVPAAIGEKIKKITTDFGLAENEELLKLIST